MKHSQAVEYLRLTLWATQKVRSNFAEMAQNDPVMYKIQVDLFPKLVDDRWLLTPLLKLIERVDSGGAIAPMEFYNIMTVINRWTENILDVVIILKLERVEQFPEPDIQWLKGWEHE